MAGGRQREFDQTEALESAMKVFWKKGYFGASLTDLTQSMGINKPSLYATFGNKEQLFIKATARYIETNAKKHGQYLLGDAPLKQRLLNYFTSIVAGQTQADAPKGCYVTVCVSEAEAEALPPEAAICVTQIRDFAETFLTNFFIEEEKQGSLPAKHNPRALAQFIVMLLHGSASMARTGKTQKELLAIFEIALNGLFDHR